MPVNRVPWSLLNKLPQVLQCVSILSTRVPQVPRFLECLSSLYALSCRVPQVPECLESIECPSALSARMSECLQSTNRVPKWEEILDLCLSEQIYQKCRINQMIFMPKLLHKNRS